MTPDFQPGQRVRILADATVVRDEGHGMVLVEFDNGSLCAVDHGDFEVRVLGHGRGSRPAYEWAVETEPDGYLHVVPEVRDLDGDVATNLAAAMPTGRVMRRRVDRGPWEVAPGG